MSKRASIIRYNCIIKKLRRNSATLQEIQNYLRQESDVQDYKLTVSQRTFQRDVEEIFMLYGIEIKYDFSKKAYYINMQDKEAEHNERLLEAFDTFNALNIKDRISNYIHFEQRRPQGTENFNGLLHAIQNAFEITFAYQKYWCDTQHIRHVQPYALKEYKNRWYLFALDTKDNRYKTFGLDRLSDLCITAKKFVRPAFDIENYFRYAFGIISDGNQTPEEIILSFTPFQGKYIKSLPLHHTQQIITDNDKELRVSLKIHSTHDFLMELLSFGDNVKVIQPQSLIDEMKTQLQNAVKLYEFEAVEKARRRNVPICRI